jgi:hypothetical protein
MAAKSKKSAGKAKKSAKAKRPAKSKKAVKAKKPVKRGLKVRGKKKGRAGGSGVTFNTIKFTDTTTTDRVSLLLNGTNNTTEQAPGTVATYSYSNVTTITATVGTSVLAGTTAKSGWAYTSCEVKASAGTISSVTPGGLTQITP